MNQLPTYDHGPAAEAEEEMALAFLAQFRAFERALRKAGFSKSGFSHRHGLPDWEGFARHIERTFEPQGSPAVQAAVAFLLGISLRRLDDRELSQMVPSDRSPPIVWPGPGFGPGLCPGGPVCLLHGAGGLGGV